MTAIARTFDERLTGNEADFLEGCAAFATYGEDTHLRMMEGLVAKSAKHPRESRAQTMHHIMARVAGGALNPPSLHARGV